jgi:hypothetical protein
VKLLRASIISGWLTKLSANVPSIAGLTGEGMATLAHGTQGRLSRLAAVRNKLRKVEGPRAYAPRLSRPGS